MAYVTVTVTGNTRWLAGLSTDIKPTLPLDGMTTMLMETNTGSEFKWTGTRWLSAGVGGALNVHTQHVHKKPITKLFHRHNGVQSTLAVATIAGATQVTLADATGFLVGKRLHLGNGVREASEPKITAIATNTLTLSHPLDFAWPIGTPAEISEANMRDVIGTINAPVSYILQPDHGEIWHIMSFVIGMRMVTAGDDSNFGDLAELTNGLTLRGYNGEFDQYRTFTSWQNNSQIKGDMGELSYTDKAGPGEFGLLGNGLFHFRTGAVALLDGNKGDYLEVLVQDDLTGLIDLAMKGQGHVEGA